MAKRTTPDPEEVPMSTTTTPAEARALSLLDAANRAGRDALDAQGSERFLSAVAHYQALNAEAMTALDEYARVEAMADRIATGFDALTADTICTICGRPADDPWTDVAAGFACVARIHDRFAADNALRSELVARWTWSDRLTGIAGLGDVDADLAYTVHRLGSTGRTVTTYAGPGGRRRRRILRTLDAARIPLGSVTSIERATRRTWIVGWILLDDAGQKVLTPDGRDVVRYKSTIAGGRL